jgi:hypothetical protein
MHVPGGLVCALIFSALATAQVRTAEAAEAAGPAPSSSGSKAVVDALVLAGDASGDVEEVVQRAILRGLGGAGVGVIERPASAAPGPCTNATCAAALAAAGGAGFVVGGEIRVAQRSYEVTLELHDGRDGRVLATRTASCPICSMPEVEAATASAAAELAGELAARAESPLTIHSCPSGAQVYIDGTLAGTTPFAETVAPGAHRIEVKADGHVPQSREVNIDAGVAPEPIAVSLAPRSSGSALAPLGWAAVGLGGVTFITGIALLALDDNPFRAHCSGDNVDSFGRCRFQYNTLGGGVAGLIVGAGLVGAGAALLVIDRKRRGASPRAAARLRFGVHPRGVMLSGSF